MPQDSLAVTAQPNSADLTVRRNLSASSGTADITSAKGGQRIDPRSGAPSILHWEGIPKTFSGSLPIYPMRQAMGPPTPRVLNTKTNPGSSLFFPMHQPIRHGELGGSVDTAAKCTVKTAETEQEEWEIVVVGCSPEIPMGRFTKDELLNRFRSRFKEFQSNPPLPTITIRNVIEGEHPEWLQMRVQSAVANACASVATRCAKYLIEAAFRRVRGTKPQIRVMRDETSDESVDGASEAWLPSVDSLLATFIVQVADTQALNSGRQLARTLMHQYRGIAISPMDQVNALANAFINEDCADIDEALTPELKRDVQTSDPGLATEAWKRLLPSENDNNSDRRPCYWDEKFILNDLALVAIQPAFIENIERRLMSVGPLPQSDAAISATRARMYSVVDECAPETSAALKRDFIDKYGEPTRNNRVLLYGLAGTGKTTLVTELIKALQRPKLEVNSLAQLLSPDFINDMIRTATHYGRSDLVVHAHEMSLGDNQEEHMKTFLNHYQRHGWLHVRRRNGMITKLDVIVIFDANDSFVDRIFTGAAGLQQAGNDRIAAIVNVVNGPEQRTLAAKGRRDELLQMKLDATKEQLRNLVKEQTLDRSNATEQWQHTKSLVTKIKEVIDTCLPHVEDAGNMAGCTMGIVRRVMDDLYTRVQRRLQDNWSVVVEPQDERLKTQDERLKIFVDFNRHMKDPRAPDSVREEIKRMGGLVKEEPSRPGSVAAENEGMNEEHEKSGSGPEAGEGSEASGSDASSEIEDTSKRS